jgi:serine/threonine-protein kinase SRPK3
VWDLFYNKHMFDGIDPETNKLTNQHHIAEIVACLGPPPLEFLQRSEVSRKYFDCEGENSNSLHN